MVVSSGKNGFQFAAESAPKKHKKPKKSALVEIDAAIGSDAFSDEASKGLLSKIFLTAQDSFLRHGSDLLEKLYRRRYLRQERGLPILLGHVGGARDGNSFSNSNRGNGTQIPDQHSSWIECNPETVH